MSCRTPSRPKKAPTGAGCIPRDFACCSLNVFSGKQGRECSLELMVVCLVCKDKCEGGGCGFVESKALQQYSSSAVHQWKPAFPARVSGTKASGNDLNRANTTSVSQQVLVLLCGTAAAVYIRMVLLTLHYKSYLINILLIRPRATRLSHRRSIHDRYTYRYQMKD